MKKLKPFILVVLIIGGIILTNEVYGQGAALSISPVTFELTANPGDVLVNKLRILNLSESTVAVKMEVEDFTVIGEMGEVKIMPAETKTYSLAHWVRTDPTEFTLAPKEQKFVDFIIDVPDNAEPGGKYGSVLATTVGVISPAEGMAGVAVAQKIGSLVLLAVSGEVVEEIGIKEFIVPSFSEYGPVPFTIRFENTGTIHVRPRGFVTITNWQGKKVVDIPFPQQNVIPGAIRKIETSWDKKWLAGRYTATIIGSYGTANIPITPWVINFWVFPWKLALGIFLAVLAITIYFVKTRKRWRMALRILIKGENA